MSISPTRTAPAAVRDAPAAATRAALVLIYNHRYEKNIDRLESIYAGRFAAIFHVMPFYQGDRANVIGVYEHSYQFQGYFAQALPRIYDPSFTHYVLAGDDLLLNPTLSENDLHERLGAAPEQGYIKTLIPVSSMSFAWFHLYNTVNHLRNIAGVEASGELPAPDEARRILRERCGLEVGDLGHRNLTRGYHSFILPDDAPDTPPERLPKAPRVYRHVALSAAIVLAHALARVASRQRAPLLKYPFVIGYSDFVLVPGRDVLEFARYCGVFAAMRVFAEMAIPTALALACESVLTERRAKMRGKEVWDDDIRSFEEEYDRDLATLARSYGDDTLYVHPVKLSRWRGVFAEPAASAV